MSDPSGYLFPSGVILGRDLKTIHPVDMHNPAEIQEFVSHSWYKYKAGKDKGLHPYGRRDRVRLHGPKPPYKQLDVDKQYSWLKAPRWKGKSVEVGPLARRAAALREGPPANHRAGQHDLEEARG